MKKETLKVYEVIRGLPVNKFYIGEKTGVFINTGKEPAYLLTQEGQKYCTYNYWFEEVNKLRNK